MHGFMKQTHSICCKKHPIRLLMHGMENVIPYTMFVVIVFPPGETSYSTSHFELYRNTNAKG